MKTLILILASFFALALPAKSQVYSDTQTSTANGLCVGCNISNAGNSADVSLSNYETMNLTVGLLGANITQRLSFPSTGNPTYYVGIVVEDVSGGGMNSALLNSISLTTYKSGVSNNDTKTSSVVNISSLGGTLYKMEFQSEYYFDAIEVKMSAGLVGALSSLRVYYGYYKAASPLPIELLSFAAKQENSGVMLSWATATEENNDHFTIERSGDALTYKEVGQVDGAGTTALSHSYDFDDANPSEGINYYRLKQTDYDGRSKYFNIVTANYTMPVGADYAVYPNPSSGDEIHFRVTESDAQVRVMSTDGTTVFTKQYAAAGDYTENLRASGNVKNGLYFITFTSGKGSSTIKTIIR